MTDLTCSPDAIIKTEKLSFPFKTPDPFLFCVYHRDLYPAGNEKMEAPKVGNGADFNFNSDYRMYHGKKIPGFPQHPHRGFETITATMEGLIDHTDSKKNSGRYGEGDVQWMTAGSGIVHGENFPLVNKDRPNYTKFFQIWLNLESKKKMVEPMFKMHWANDIPVIIKEDGGVEIRVWAGKFEKETALDPPPNSWAANNENEVGIFAITLKPGKSVLIPSAKYGKAINRALYFINGTKMECNGQTFNKKGDRHLTLDASMDVLCKNLDDNNNGDDSDNNENDMLLLILQGRPINEPVAQHGPFVMNTKAEIYQAFSDYQSTKFGGWPWEDDAVVFPRDKGRFSNLNGVETFPSSS